MAAGLTCGAGAFAAWQAAPAGAADTSTSLFSFELHAGARSDPSPNIHLAAAALDNSTSGDAVLNQVGGAVGNIGKIVTHSESTTSSDGGKSLGSSNITDINIADVVKIKSIASTATAAT